MRAGQKQLNKAQLLRDLVPLNALSEDSFNDLVGRMVIEEVKSGRYLFRKGERDNQTIYLLDGAVNLVDGYRKITGKVEAGSDGSRHPIAGLQPRAVSARTTRKSVIARVDSGLLDVFLTKDQSGMADVAEIGVDDLDADWMTRLLQNPALKDLPPSKIQGLLIRMQSCPVSKGDVIIEQGDEGDYFYTIHEGRCAVTRRDPPGGEPHLLAELGAGDAFGEDALVARTTRNATVTMLTDGVLMRLGRNDFDELLKTSFIRHVSFQQATKMVDDGAVWVDVRTPDEYAGSHLEDSVNMPLADLRNELSELMFNTSYIICCDTGRRSECAGFMLRHRGFDVCVLEGGLGRIVDAVSTTEARTPAEETQQAEIIDLQRHGQAPSAGRESGPDNGVPASSGQQGSREREAELRGRIRTLQQKLDSVLEQSAASERNSRQYRDELQLLRSQYEALQEEYADHVGRVEKRLREVEQQRQSQQHQSAEQEARWQRAEHELKSLQSRLAASEAALQASRNAEGAGRNELNARMEELVQQLQQACHERDGASSELAELRRIAERSAAENAERVSSLLANRQSADESTERLRREFNEIKQALEKNLRNSEASNDELGERLAAREEHNEQLMAELAASREQVSALQLQIDNHSGDNLAADEQLRLWQDQWAQQHEDLTGQLGEERRRADRLAAELATVREQLAGEQDERARLGAQLQASDQQAELTAGEVKQALADEQDRTAGLQQELASRQQEIATLRQELEAVSGLQEGIQDEQEKYRCAQQETEQARREASERQEEVEALREQLAEVGESAARELDELRSLLVGEQDALRALQEKHDEQAGRLAAVREDAAGKDNELAVLRREVESLRSKTGNLQESLQQHEDRAKSREQEYQDAARKSHDDLTRKNENEKELQGQIDRLRKKLEQTTADLRAAREHARSDADSIREELHAERRARDEERSRMAARQRELKEQLAAYASQHEVVVTNQSGAVQEAVEEAVSKVRAEERERLQAVLDSQSQTEQQIALLQAELRQAHEDIAERDRREQERPQVDVDLMQEQAAQSQAAINQLESQLRQLTAERDTVLAERQRAREQISSLRSEVEAARGRLEARDEEQAETIADVRAELDDTRRNIEIAARLRSEAESARDSLIAERNELRSKIDTLLAQAAAREERAERFMQQSAAQAAAARPAAAVSHVPAVPRERLRFGLAVLSVLLVAGVIAAIVRFAPRISLPTMPTASDLRLAQPPEGGEADTEPKAPAVDDTDASAGQAPDQAPAAVLRTFSDPLKDGGRGPVMVELAAASYQMGSAGNSLNFDESPQHLVSLQQFAISKHEVTFGDYARFARATGHRLPSDEKWGRGNRPVINVSWDDARAYVKWLSGQTGHSYRLPTESQWEYAVRGGVGESWWWSGGGVHANCFGCGSKWDGKQTAPVGSFAANSFGLHDMTGNVQEWTEDCYVSGYKDAPADGAAVDRPHCTHRVVRGGAYSSPKGSLRSAKRVQLDHGSRLNDLGFRVVRIK